MSSVSTYIGPKLCLIGHIMHGHLPRTLQYMYMYVHVHSIPQVLSLQAEPGSSEPAPSGQVLSPSQPLPPLEGMGMPPHITADQQVNRA